MPDGTKDFLSVRPHRPFLEARELQSETHGAIRGCADVRKAKLTAGVSPRRSSSEEMPRASPISLSANGRFAVDIGWQTVSRLDVATLETVTTTWRRTFRASTPAELATMAAVSNDGNEIVLGDGNGAVSSGA